MKINKKIIAVAAAVLLLGGAHSAMAFGHFGGGMMGGGYGGGYCGNFGGGYGPGMMGGYFGGTAEQQQEFADLNSNFYKQMEPKLQQLQAKQMELSALSGNSNAKPEAISKLAQEIAALNAELRQMGQDFQTQMQGKFGANGGAYGPMMGGRGYGHGGYGHRGGRW
jgi:zinc resistance-associated protein